MVMINHPLRSDLYTTSPPGEGPDLSYAEQIWTKLAQSECRIDMLSKLTKLKIGLREVQEYSDALQLRIRSDNFKNKSEQNVEKLILDRMNFILRDEKCYCGELGVTRDRLRREMKVFLGENTRRTRTIITHLRSLASKEKIFHTARYSKKLNYLRERFVMRGSEKLDEVPDDLRKQMCFVGGNSTRLWKTRLRYKLLER